MKLRFRSLLILIIAGAFLACSQEQVMAGFVPDDVDQFAREYIEIVRSGDLSQAYLMLDDSKIDKNAVAILNKYRKYLNSGKVLSTERTLGYIRKEIKVLGEERENYTRYYVEYYVQYSTENMDNPFDEFDIESPDPDEHGIYHQIIKVIIDRVGDEKIVYGIKVKPIRESIKSVHSLNIFEKPVWQILFFVIILAIPIFVIYSAWVCIKTPIKRKWFWFIFIFLGLGKISLNWTTGQISGDITAIQLMGAGALRWGLYGPWHFILSLPLGAVLFHYKRTKLKKPEEPFNSDLLNNPDYKVGSEENGSAA